MTWASLGTPSSQMSQDMALVLPSSGGKEISWTHLPQSVDIKNSPYVTCDDCAAYELMPPSTIQVIHSQLCLVQLTFKPVLRRDRGANTNVATDCWNCHLVSKESTRHAGPILQNRSSFAPLVNRCFPQEGQIQCDQKKSPNVYKSCPKTISLEKW